MGGALYSALNSSIKFENNSLVQFAHNTAKGESLNHEPCGGAIFQEFHSIIVLSAKSLALFTNNNATQSGGAIHSSAYSEVSIEGNASFKNNTAKFGGALCFDPVCAFKFKGNTLVEFDGNIAAADGGAIYDGLIYGIDTYGSAKYTHDSHILIRTQL